MDRQVYKKKGRRYVPVGYSDGWVGFPTDGIWLVQTTPGRKSSECILKISDIETVIPYAANVIKYKDKVKEYLLKNDNIGIMNITVNDVATEIIKLLSDDKSNEESNT